MAERISLKDLMVIIDLLPNYENSTIFPSQESQESFLAVYGWTMSEFETELIKLYSSDNIK